MVTVFLSDGVCLRKIVEAAGVHCFCAIGCFAFFGSAAYCPYEGLSVLVFLCKIVREGCPRYQVALEVCLDDG